MSAYKNLLKRFLKEFITANSHVIADMVAVWYTFRDKHFCMDLMMYQFKRKLSWEGLKPTIISFILKDTFLQQKFKLHKILG